MMGPPPPPMTRSFIYKSNSSLDLDHDDAVVSPAQPDYQQLRREYGSQVPDLQRSTFFVTYERVR